MDLWIVEVLGLKGRKLDIYIVTYLGRFGVNISYMQRSGIVTKSKEHPVQKLCRISRTVQEIHHGFTKGPPGGNSIRAP